MDIVSQGLVFDAGTEPAALRSCAFTSVISLSSGEYLASFRIAEGRDIPGGRVRLMQSSGHGSSWHTVHEGLTFEVNGMVGDLYSGYLFEPLPGDLVGAFVWVDRSDARSFVNPATTGILPTRNLLARSSDAGRTWVMEMEVDLGPESGCTFTGPIFRASESRLGLPYETWKSWDDASDGRHTASVRWSDDGFDWSRRAIVATDATGRLLFWDQRIAVHPTKGDLVAMFWTHDREAGADRENHISWSADPDAAWSVPRSCGWSGQHCQPVPLGGDRLAAVSVRRDPPGAIEVRVSEDFGQRWSDRVLQVYVAPERPNTVGSSFEAFWQSMMTWEFGHPRAVATPEGDVLIVWYAAGESGGTNVHWARVRL